MKLNLSAELNRTSYGYHASYTYKYLTKMGWEISHIPIFPERGSDLDPKFVVTKRDFFHDAPCLRIWHQNNLTGFTGKEKIGFTVFELEDLTPTEINNMKYPDKLLVPSKWGQEVCRNHGIPSVVVPLGYDHESFVPAEFPQQEHTVFANFGKWEIRKGHDVLIKAFNAAFTEKDEVTLVMMPSNPFLKPEQVSAWERMYLGSRLGSKIQIIPRQANHHDVFNIMRQVDCGVFPARAEGWNLEPLELLGCGKHLIITNCTGQSEYLTENNSMLINIEDKFESAYDGVFFNGFGRWRKFGQDAFDQLVEKMRAFHKNRPNILQNTAGILESRQFSWENSVVKLSQELLS